MESVWLDPDGARGAYIFAGDIGGTHTSFALVREDCGAQDSTPRIAAKFLFKTPDICSINAAAGQAREEAARGLPRARITKACLSAAGIVKDNACSLTNVPWAVSGDEIQKTLGVPVKIINDFTALSYALPLLDPDNPREVTPLAPPGGTPARPSGKVRAVLGAGTGLGVGCLVETDSGFTALASEGGHTDFAAVDEQTRGLCDWVTKRIGGIPETELFVSGQGLINMFLFFHEKALAAGSLSAAFNEIAQAPDAEKPALIARAADGDPGCGSIMRLFVRMYARAASNIAVTFLPTAGLYLAGGIAGKNELWFLSDDAFMKNFLAACKPKIRDMLKTIPVYIIKDYSVSLLGAANAARCLIKDV
ncbi:MAG: glucokinase [Spirochaetales bacterium]|jgi:glucokinase|nr:glucokinase [Spirochaetales bacterium]